jgi:hypothetical protein
MYFYLHTPTFSAGTFIIVLTDTSDVLILNQKKNSLQQLPLFFSCPKRITKALFITSVNGAEARRKETSRRNIKTYVDE